jgi:glycosyltransferase involved in cell wall biosynthesis
MKTKKPIKIAFDASSLLVNKTGVAFYIERIMKQLALRYPDDVELICFYYNFLGRRDTDHFPKLPNVRYRPIRFIPSKVIYQLRRFGIEIPLELLVKERVDFVLFGNFLGYPSIFKVPAAPVVHDLTYLDLPEYVAVKNRNDLTRFVPQQIKRSKFVVTVSEFSKKKIIQNYNVAPDSVLVTPIPPEEPQKFPEAERATQIKKLGISKPFILFLSTIEPRKNLVNLIDAYAKLPDDLRQKYTLVVTGRIGWNCDPEIARLKKSNPGRFRRCPSWICH